MKFLLSIAVIFVAVSLSHAITSIPINGIKASATLPDLGQKSYRPENMIMKKNVHPFYQVWAAKYKDKPITLEFLVEAQELDVITLYNGYMRDSSSYTNYSQAKTIRIYQNTTDNLVKTVTLLKPQWGGYKIHRPDIVVFEKPLKNVFKIIIEIDDIYPGKIYQDVCIALVKFWGFPRIPRKLNAGQVTDVRDGQVYNTIKVGGQIWMAEDLRHKTPGSRPFIDASKPNLKLPKDAGLEYPESDINNRICPEGWRLPLESEFASLKSSLPESATFDDFFSTANRRPFYAIYEKGNSGIDPALLTDVEEFFYPTDAYGFNFSRLTRRYYDQQCIEESGGEKFAFASYWTYDAKEIPLWPDEDGNVEVKKLRFYRFGGTDYCEAMLCTENYHFVRCIMAPDPVDPNAIADSSTTDSSEAPANLNAESSEAAAPADSF